MKIKNLTISSKIPVFDKLKLIGVSIYNKVLSYKSKVKNCPLLSRLCTSKIASEGQNLSRFSISDAFLSHFSGYRKIAFTLAEVLITLGIIGVVAAMTMPALIQSYQKQVAVTKLKRVYSALSQSIELSKVEYGDICSWDWTLRTKDFYDKYFTKKLSVVKSCAPNEGGCWNATNTITLLSGSGTELDMSNYPKMILSDGTFVAIFKQDNNHVHIYLDLNGMKSPNTYGKDCFELTLTKGAFQDDAHNIFQAGLYFYGYGLTKEQLEATSPACVRNKSGIFCGLKIMMDGWQIKNDYPW